MSSPAHLSLPLLDFPSTSPPPDDPRPTKHPIFSLPNPIQARILAYLPPEDLEALGASGGYWTGVERDGELRRIWRRRTAPARVEWLLFGEGHCRPDPRELVRLGIIKGVGIVSAVQRQGCWTSREAVRISHIHATIAREYLDRHLTRRLSPSHRPTPSALCSAGLLHPSCTFAASLIQARAHELERLRKRAAVRRSLEEGRVGRSLGEVMYGLSVVDGSEAGGGGAGARTSAAVWDDASQRVMAALCPDSKQKRRFWEDLARGVTAKG